jgi:hypothetical protein
MSIYDFPSTWMGMGKDSIRDRLKDHLESQPRKVVDEKGEKVDFSSEVDSGGNIRVEVNLSGLRNQIADLEAEVTDLEEEVRSRRADENGNEPH